MFSPNGFGKKMSGEEQSPFPEKDKPPGLKTVVLFQPMRDLSSRNRT